MKPVTKPGRGLRIADQSQREEDRGLSILRIARSQPLHRLAPGAGTLLVVTHGANIRALTGISPATGEIVVVDTATEAIGRIPTPR